MTMDPLFVLAPWVIFFPLIGMAVNILFGKKLGEKGSGIVGSLGAGLAFVTAVLLAYGLTRQPEGAVYPLANWISLGDLNVGWNFRVDTLSAVMMLVVSGVGTLIHIYSIGYMHNDVRHNGDPSRFQRFFIYMNLFILMMMILVTADNFLMLFVGWEGVGLCSYLLIGFWFEKGADGIGNAKAAKKAMVANRIGDFGLLIAMFLIFYNFGTFDFTKVFAAAPQAAPGAVLAITLFLLLGVTGKSAQIPLYVWLPDAMAGPTPVSALIHAATMVTAGVYLIARSQALYVQAPAAQAAVMWIGAATALFAATIAVGQNDIKKVLAYSTISQLGYMVAAVGMGATVAGMFHLVTHAFFKALLFLSAGSVIMGMEHGHEHAAGGEHSEFDPQDMRNMGGLRKQMPVTFWVYTIGALALSGIAPLAGFFSKDEILAAASKTGFGLYLVLALAAFLTAFYMARQIVLVFFGPNRSEAAQHAKESPAVVTVPLIILAALSVLGGGLNFPGISSLEKWLEHSLYAVEQSAFVPLVAVISTVVALLGLLVGWLIYGRKPISSAAEPDPLAHSLGGIFSALQHKWWVDELYQAVILKPYQGLANFLAHPVDQGAIDGLVNGLATTVRGGSAALRKLENGYVRSYALTIFFGVVAIITYLVLH